MIVIIKEIIPNLEKLKGWQIRNILLEHEPLWDIDNGITLCKDCHKIEKRKDKRIINGNLSKGLK